MDPPVPVTFPPNEGVETGYFEHVTFPKGSPEAKPDRFVNYNGTTGFDVYEDIETTIVVETIPVENDTLPASFLTTRKPTYDV